MIDKSRDDFFEHIDNKDIKTINAYNFRVNNFEDYCFQKYGKKDIIPAHTEKQDQLDVFQKWVNQNSKTKSPNTVWNYAASLRKYTYYRGWKIAKGDLDDLIELPAKHEKELYGLQLSDIHMIFDALSFRDKLLHSFDAVSGTRIGETVQLRKKHFSIFHDRIMVKIPSTVAKFHRARTTFVSKEIGSALQARLNRIEPDDLVFGTKPFDSAGDRKEIAKAVHSSESTKEDNLRRVLEKTGLNMRHDDTKRYQINTHSFRAWFITKMSRHDENLAKLFSGEKGYLLQYDRLSDEEKLDEYKKAEPRLIIDDSAKQQYDLQQLKIRNAELEKTHVPKEKIIDEVTKKVIEALTKDATEEEREKIHAKLNLGN